MTLTAVLFYLVPLNAMTWMAFRSDKHRALAKTRRIPEITLLALSLCGGWPAAKLAQRRFRHKTRKQPFGFMLNVVPVIWAGVIVVPLALSHLETLEFSGFGAKKDRDTPRFFQSVSN
ncbi:DUF1294 domain-containing protein [uncultured Roseobacter sp.]|uniref:DUF1294 domain-containing protein n=1 Tax=uncultured Roseobacter sp. TaxID=114847 RepID=UPI002602E84E|nr:DUF1294 domain-containing protein [uncultured Roseobacter sp.]